MHQPNVYHFRSFGPGLGILVMFILLLITLTILKVKSPTLSKASDEQENFQPSLLFPLIVSILSIISLTLYLIFESSLYLTFFFGTSEFLFRFGLKVCYPIYLIRQAPNLNQYVYSLILKFKAKFLPSNVIDVIV